MSNDKDFKDLTLSEINKLKVAELKERLSCLGLPNSGLKDDLVSRLHSYCQVRAAGADSKTDEEANPIEKETIEGDTEPQAEKTAGCEETSPKFRDQVTNFMASTNGKIQALMAEVHILKETKTTHAFEGAVNDLKKEKSKLIQENLDLRERNLNLSLIMSDLNTKVKHLEQEKDSLVTALTLQKQDYQHSLNNLNQHSLTSETTNSLQTVKANKYKRRQCQANEATGSQGVNTKNRYEILSEKSDSELQTNSQIDSQPDDKETNTQTERMTEHQSTQERTGTQNEHARAAGTDVIIIGDSIIKNIQPNKLTRRKVHKYTFPGRTADQIEKEINFSNVQTIPSHVIIHVGTNNLPLESAKQCAQKIEKLATRVKDQFPNSKIGLSGLTVRHDIELTEEIQEVNNELERVCTKLDIAFVDNSTLDDTCLNGSKLHLNAKGSAILAVHFIQFLRGDRPTTSPRKKSPRREDFQKSAIQKLGELLKIIIPPDRNTPRGSYW